MCVIGHWVLSIICHGASSSILSLASIHPECKDLWHCRYSTYNGKQAVVQFLVSSAHSPGMRYNVNAFIVLQITGDQPVCVISPDQNWKHLEGLTLADPEYNKPGGIDVLLGVETFVEVICHGRRFGPHNTPIALDTAFG